MSKWNETEDYNWLFEERDKAEALAAKQEKLLRRVEKKMVFCFLCDGRLDNFGDRDTLKGLGYVVGHATDCELAKALVSEQSEEELGDDNDE